NLIRGGCRVREGTQHIKNRPPPQLTPYPRDSFHSRVKVRSKHKTEADLVQGLGTEGRRDIDRDSELDQNVGASRSGRDSPIPVLGHRNAGSGDDEYCSGGDVEGLPSTTRSRGINTNRMTRLDRYSFPPHDSSKSRDLFRGFPLFSQCN